MPILRKYGSWAQVCQNRVSSDIFLQRGTLFCFFVVCLLVCTDCDRRPVGGRHHCSLVFDADESIPRSDSELAS